MTTKCQGIWGELFGHKYYPVYEKETSTSGQSTGFSISDDTLQEAITDGELLSSIIESTRDKTSKTVYIHSVCSRCGDVIKKDPENADL
jgi:hypothetical protein